MIPEPFAEPFAEPFERKPASGRKHTSGLSTQEAGTESALSSHEGGTESALSMPTPKQTRSNREALCFSKESTMQDLEKFMLAPERKMIAAFRDYVSDVPPLDWDTLPNLAAEWGLPYAVKVREQWEEAIDDMLIRLDALKAKMGDNPMIGAAMWLAGERLRWLGIRENLAAQAGEMARQREEAAA